MGLVEVNYSSRLSGVPGEEKEGKNEEKCLQMRREEEKWLGIYTTDISSSLQPDDYNVDEWMDVKNILAG